MRQRKGSVFDISLNSIRERSSSFSKEKFLLEAKERAISFDATKDNIKKSFDIKLLFDEA